MYRATAFLVVLSTAAGIGILAAGTASAAQLCAVDVPGDGKCPTAANEAETEKAIEGISTNPTLTTSITTYTCEGSELDLDPDSSTGEPITGSVTGLSFSGNCKSASGTACTLTVVNLPYHASLESTDLTVTSSSGIGFAMKCGFLINCTFSTKKSVLALTHSAAGTTAVMSGIKLERSGGFCPETAELDATYVFPNVTVL